MVHAAVASGIGSGPISGSAGLASWLGVTLVLVLCLNTLGGWVRLSGSGVAIPQWPILTRADGTRTVLPPWNDADWQAAFAAFSADQQRMRALVAEGIMTSDAMGRQPATLDEYKGMYWTEWSHRLLAGFVGAWVLALVVCAWRSTTARPRVAWMLTAMGALVGTQALLGGMLVHHGTGTRWLFLHQANAGAIVAVMLWSLLTLLREPEARRQRHPARWPASVAVLMVWSQLIAGAWLASSANHGPISMASAWWSLPTTVWDAQRSVAWNLLDNVLWHSWVHAWLVVVLIALMAWLAWCVWRHGSGPRLRLALGLMWTFVAVQALLGFMTAGGRDALVSLAHQFTGVCMLCAAVLAAHDAFFEKTTAVREGLPA